MPIIQPTTFDQLTDALNQIDVFLKQVYREEKDGFKLNDLVSLAYSHSHNLGVSGTYLRAKLEDARGMRVEHLASHLAPGEMPEDIRAGVVMLVESALAIRSPLPPQPLAAFLLDQMQEVAAERLGHVWTDECNPFLRTKGAYYDALNGDPISFVELNNSVKEINAFIRSITGYSGNTQPSDDVIAKEMGRFAQVAREIMKQAEARLPQPKPVTPTRQPIFAWPVALTA